MSKQTLKSIARRGSMFVAAAGLLAATAAPAAVFADALNPLTQRSLLLSSSSPGWHGSDGSGNSEGAPNSVGEYYAPPGSGPNGTKTGHTFTFNVSTDSVETERPIRAFTFQYCTTAAGLCKAPGNNTGDSRTENRELNATAHAAQRSDLDVVYASPVEGTHYDVYVDGSLSTGWTMAASNVEDNGYNNGVAASGVDGLTGKNNYITLSNATGASPVFNDTIRIVFKATTTHYITNPGSNEFFVKINTYDHVSDHDEESNIDGGVTVANVMTNSIHITTKVLETMAFSVGTVNRDTVVLGGGQTHGTCDPIESDSGNRLNLGNPNAEYSLETGTAWDVHSYWRLSSNSSGGATVYYSGNTLANTVGDEIQEIGPTATESTRGTEQFGLAFDDASTDTFDPAFYNPDYIDEDETPEETPGLTQVENPRHKLPSLLLATGTPDVFLAPETNYANGVGHLNNPGDTDGDPALFAFEKASLTVPRVIAQNNQMVISCATAKMRYVANIGADTPAGVYTTKINYLAAPQY